MSASLEAELESKVADTSDLLKEGHSKGKEGRGHGRGEGKNVIREHLAFT